jgi:hypothetical protein
LNNGMIDVENLPGRGCIFRISLPGNRRDAPQAREVMNG